MNPLLSMKRSRAALALVAALLGLFQLIVASPARANTSQIWTVMYWDITSLQQGGPLAAQRYDDMLRELRRHVDSRPANQQGGFLARTEAQTGRYVEIRVTDSGDQFLSLFYRTDNLYLDGFRIAGSNYQFRDAPSALRRNYGGNQLFTTIYGGHYGNGGLDAQNVRGNTSFMAHNLRNQFVGLRSFSYGTRNDYTLHLANIVQATSEAARFGWIQNRISNTIRNGGEHDGYGWQTTLGGFGTALENRWSDLSRLAFQTQNGGNGNPVTVGGQTYNNLTDMQHGNPPARPALAYLMGLGSQAL
ncbi:ribosome-inactivating family protein [Streptomyces sp. NPDC013012]|uniref:ribosome-inactivating family protein n=1 Tax=Streptomyces sp. NPDC013012 TaxID=3364860 RepID=UPI0036994F7D